MNKRFVVRLSDEERHELVSLVTRGTASAKKIVHAQILLKIDADGPSWTDERAAESFHVHETTVRAIRQRFVLEGLEAALIRKKRDKPPRERRLDGAGEARLIALACGKAPNGRTRWTLRLLAEGLVELDVVDSICRETVRQTLKKTN